ncbi:helix-turn-helix domain-containing protein [Nakamurella sp. YIM 132087]|uniref:Helix-turn-helix domain-containing protein n=1 Tax=Nakamurella alba TaxID=2665158 RepID=A0A7K1FTH0_9ACTN|nr:helix-turn-helix domain-containing protein [Nakamurella alba]
MGAVQSVDRAVTALEHLARNGESGVSEIATVIGVHKSTASRLMSVLHARDLVEPAGERGRYRLGPGVLRLAGAMGSRLDVSTQGATICAELAAQSGETVNLAVRQGEVVVNVHQSDGSGAISVDSWIGRPTPLHATSSGKVLLAHAPEDIRERAFAQLQPFTGETVTDPVVLAGQLEQVRRAGYAMTVGELEIGLNAVAAPVFRSDGVVVAALSVSAPAYRLPASALPTLGHAVVAAALRVSERMGWSG